MEAYKVMELELKLPSPKVDQPITIVICNLNILGAKVGWVHIFQRCALLSQIKPKWNFIILQLKFYSL